MDECIKQRISLGTPSVDQAADFLVALGELCNKHGIWISHEDWYGRFELQFSSTEEWLMSATRVESFDEVIVTIPPMGEIA